MLMQNWMHNWKMAVQEVHSRITMPSMDVSVMIALARVAYKYPTQGRETEGNSDVFLKMF